MSLLVALFVQIARISQTARSDEDVPLTRKAAQVERFRSLLDEHCRQRTPVERYARELGVTAGQLTRMCREVMGMSTLDAINARVVHEAQRELVYSSLSIKQIAAEFVARIVGALGDAGVVVRADERTRALASEASGAIEAAGEEDWGTEYLAMTLAVKVVSSTEEAIEHIGRYGSGHSEAIVTRDTESARAFQLGVDAACVYVNASTRFTDGGEFGMGAEIGISTDRFHAVSDTGHFKIRLNSYYENIQLPVTDPASNPNSLWPN